MTEIPQTQAILRVADLPQRKGHRFALTPDPDTCARIAEALDLSGLRKLSFAGRLRAEGRDDWVLEAKLGATAIQACVITLQPVTTRIDQPVTRRFVRNLEIPVESDEVEMPEDESTEPLPAEIDLIAVISEALALALPDYPRAEDVELEQATFAAKGVTPLRDEDIKPFAGLAALKDKLEKPDE